MGRGGGGMVDVVISSNHFAVCPFCGRDNLKMESEQGMYFVLCLNCFASGPRLPIMASAIEHYNHRAIESIIASQLKRVSQW